MPADRKTQEPIRAVAIKCKSGKLHHVAYPALFTENNRDSAQEMADSLDGNGLSGRLRAKCSPHRVVELREVPDAKA